MEIPIEKLKNRPRIINVNESVTAFPELSAQVEQGHIEFIDLVHGRLEAIRVGDMIEVTGSLATTVILNCSRCLGPVTCPLNIEVVLTYVSADAAPEDVSAEDVELASEEIGLLTFSGDVIDLTNDIEQEVIMSLPPKPLCSDECRGLCLHCGCNLNKRACDCEPTVFHAGLAVLKNFKVVK